MANPRDQFFLHYALIGDAVAIASALDNGARHFARDTVRFVVGGRAYALFTTRFRTATPR